MFGLMKHFKQQDNKIMIEFEQNSVLAEVITPSIIHFFAPVSGKQGISRAVEDLRTAPGSLSVRHEHRKIVVRTEKLVVNIYDAFKVDIFNVDGTALCEDYRGGDQPFVRRGSGEGLDLAAEEGHKFAAEKQRMKIKVLKKMEKAMYFYGLGDKTGHLNKKGTHYKMWNTDAAGPHVESFEAMYKSIPFFIALKEKQAFGIFFDNTYESVFDMGKENSGYYSFGAVDGNLDYYFIYGPSVGEVVGGYTYLTGTTPLPPLWALGYQQCRWAYTPEKRLREIADLFREKDIPCDVLYLDIDYMDGYRVFTWDKTKFPDPKKMLADLRSRGFKVVTIIDPGVKKDKGYTIYDQGIRNGYFATDKDGIPYVNRVWPGDALYPDFANEGVRAWWADNQKILTDTGVAGIWNDMNEPASFNGPLPGDVVFNDNGVPADHREIHNVYGHYMSEATYEGIKKATGKRPFVVTRACYAGTQKYSTAWTGDNQSIWEHLRMSLPMLMNLGLSGMAFCGADVGGFGFDCTAELLTRWIQVGCFTPLFRNHSGIFTRDQEPWAFDEESASINRKYIKLRYRLLPYFYDIFHREEENGLPMIRPLLLHYQDDPNTYEINDQFLCGENILVAPVVEQGAKARSVYLPAGSGWVDYWTKEEFKGGRYVIKETPLDVCPVYIKTGSIIPNYPVQHYVGEIAIEELALDIYLPDGGADSHYEHYQDDGETFAYRQDAYNLYQIAVRKDGTGRTVKIALNKKYSGYKKAYRSFKFILNNIRPSEVAADGKPVAFERVENGVQFRVARAAEIVVKC